ncbi:DUF2062 domain-containing protein [Synechococcus sp. B60.2]|uniref:DUF2062 domain-containing protein n=1 Tax=unclassified Synechococcus TaxID=2626047 RepID=UPI0039C48F2B
MSPLSWLRPFSWFTGSPGSAVPYLESQPALTLPRRDLGWRRWLRYLYLRLLRMQSSPKEIARGLAAGVFAGCFPIFGFQTLVALLLAVPLRGNKLVAAAGTWVSNPLTYVPIYAFNYRVGEWLLGSRTAFATSELVVAQNWMQWGLEVSGTLFVGCAFVGFWGALVSYFLGLWLVQRIRRRRRMGRVCNTL